MELFVPLAISDNTKNIPQNVLLFVLIKIHLFVFIVSIHY